MASGYFYVCKEFHTSWCNHCPEDYRWYRLDFLSLASTSRQLLSITSERAYGVGGPVSKKNRHPNKLLGNPSILEPVGPLNLLIICLDVPAPSRFKRRLMLRCRVNHTALRQFFVAFNPFVHRGLQRGGFRTIKEATRRGTDSLVCCRGLAG